RNRGHGLLDERERRGFVTKAHTSQREVSNEDIVLWLLFKERFQFAARLSPAFLGGGMVAGDFLRPAYPNTEFAVGVTQYWIRLGQYFLEPTDDWCRAALQDPLVSLGF